MSLATTGAPAARRVAVPAYLALGVATGAGCAALSHAVTSPTYSVTIYSAWLGSLLVAYGANYGAPAVQAACRAIRLLVFAVLLPFLIAARSDILTPPDAFVEGTIAVGVIMGWVMLAAVLAVGIHIGGNLGGGAMSLTAPLVPGFSLLALLNVVGVDTELSLAFGCFAAAALYLAAYERMLRHAVTMPTTMPAVAPHEVRRTALHYLLASALWFVILLAGGALFYYPLETLLPRTVFTSAANRARAARSAALDWTGTSETVAVQGGPHFLSDRPMLKIMVGQGASQGLWRGRVYHSYESSRWDESEDANDRWVPLQGGEFVRLPQPVLAPRPALGSLRPLEAHIEPVDGPVTTLYNPGQPIALRGPWKGIVQRADGTLAVRRTLRRVTGYDLRAAVPQWRLQGLAAAPGLNAAQLDEWRLDSASARAQSLLVDAELARQLEPVTAQIQAAAHEAGDSLRTPYQKAQAVSAYLQAHCHYSLVPPPVPLGQDAVVYFLTESRAGACDMFASAMAMLLRTMNVPTRLATGYLEPEPEFRPPTGDPSGAVAGAVTDAPVGATFIIRERDAHAWVEYYVPGAGWVAHDPSAGTRIAPDDWHARLENWLRLPWLRVYGRRYLMPGVGLLVFLAGALWTWLEARATRRPRAKRQPATPAEAAREADRQRIAAAYAQAARLLRRRVPRPAHLTPQEYEAAVARAPLSPDVRQEFAALTYLFLATQYAAAPPAADPAALAACLARLRAAL